MPSRRQRCVYLARSRDDELFADLAQVGSDLSDGVDIIAVELGQLVAKQRRRNFGNGRAALVLKKDGADAYRP
jgi:hypothetical protein